MHGISVERLTGCVISEGHIFHEHALFPHAKPFAKPPGRCVVVLDIGIKAADPRLREKMRKQRPGGLECKATAGKTRVEVPADRDRISFGSLVPVGMREEVTDQDPILFQADRDLAVIPAAPCNPGPGCVHVSARKQPAIGLCI